MKVEELEIYKLANQIGDSIWDTVLKWNYFEKMDWGDNGQMRLIQSIQIFPKVLEGFLQKIIVDFAFLQEVLFMKRLMI